MDPSIIHFDLTADSLVCAPEGVKTTTNTSSIISFILTTIATLMTVFGNLLVIKVIFCKLRMEIIGGIFFVSLATCDFIIGLVIQPFSTVIEFAGKWILGETLCTMWLGVHLWFCTISIYHLCLISYERLVILNNPLSHIKKLTTTEVMIMIVGVWLSAFLVAVVPIAVWGDGRVYLTTDTKFPPDFLPTQGPNGESLSNITHISQFLDMIQDYSLQSLHQYYSPEFVDYISQERLRQVNSKMIPRIHIAIEKYKCPNTCELPATPGHATYFFFSSFLLPLVFMAFSYSIIYAKARKSRKCVEQGYLEAGGSVDGTVLKLRVHRGGQAASRERASKEQKPSPKSSRKVKIVWCPKARRTTGTNIEEPVPSTSGGTIDGRPVRPTTAEVGTSTDFYSRKGFFSRLKHFSCKESDDEEPKAEEEHSCVIEIPENTESTPQPLSTEPGSSRQASDKVDRSTQAGQGKVKKLRNRDRLSFKKLLEIFDANILRRVLQYIKGLNKAGRAIGCIMGIFTLFWGPFFTVYLVRGYCVSCVDNESLIMFLRFGFFNSAISPLTYIYWSDEYTTEVKSMFRKLLGPKRPQDIITMKKIDRKKLRRKQERMEKKMAKAKARRNTYKFFDWHNIFNFRKRRLSAETSTAIPLTTLPNREDTTDPRRICITIAETAITATEASVTAPKTTKTLLVTARRSSLATTTVPETRPITTRSASLGTIHIPETAITAVDASVTAPKTTKTLLVTARRSSLATTTVPETRPITTRSASLGNIHIPETAITAADASVTAPKTTKTLLVTARRSSLVTSIVPETRPITTRSASLGNIHIPETAITAAEASVTAPKTTKTLLVTAGRSSLVTSIVPETTVTDTQATTAPRTTARRASLLTQILPDTTRRSTLYTMRTPETTTTHTATTHTHTVTHTQATTAMPEMTTTRKQVTTTVPVITRREMHTAGSSSQDLPMEIVIEIPPDEQSS